MVKIRKGLLPILLIASIVLGLLLDFHGLLIAIIIYQLIFSLKLHRASKKDLPVKSIGIVSEHDSGGAFLAAKHQFEVYLRSSRDPVFYIPDNVELIESLPTASIQNCGSIEYLKFPSSIFRITQVLPFLLKFRKSWIRTGRPQLFAHGIRSGFLVSLCTFSKPLILLHRNIDQGLPFLTRSLIRVHRIYCRKLMSVSPVSETKRNIDFYPILSPLLVDSVDIKRSSNRSKTLPLRILWIARLDFPKLPEMLLSALQHVPKSQYTCRMVGVGPKRSNCQEMALRLNLNVEFVEQSSTLLELRQSDLVILLSDFEGVPFALQEALAAKVPVIASKLPGIEFLGGEAFIYANNEKEVLEAILKCLNADYYNEVFEINRERWNDIKMVFNCEWKIPNKQTSEND
jgi:glycosyltransferase involved in cell wall biosynthesis